MLFRRDAYEQIGGHRALAAEVVEDLALARLIKRQRLNLRYLLGLDAVDLRMYFDLLLFERLDQKLVAEAGR